MSETASMVVGALGLGLVAATSTPAFLAIFKKIYSFGKDSGYQHLDGLYEDGDGTATETTQQEFSTWVPRCLALLGSLVGLGLSLAAAIILFTTTAVALNTDWEAHTLFNQSWITFGTWVLLAVQALNLFFVHHPIQRFDLGVLGALSALVVIVVLVLETAFLRSRMDRVAPFLKDIILALVQLGVALFTALSFLGLQRRPYVFRDGQPVDAEFTVSALGRYSFSWASSSLAFARKNKGLNYEDLPKVSQYMRASFQQANFNAIKSKRRLWKQVCYNFRWAFLQQTLLILTISVTQFGPQFAMFNLLKLLEQRSKGAQVAEVAWAWVFGLGTFMIVTSLFESWMFWIVWSRLGLPIRAMLSILVFMKSTRRKDVKGVQKADEKTAEDARGDNIPAVNDSSGHKGEDTAPRGRKDNEEEDEESMQKSRQSTINLVGVDSKRVSDFATYAYIFPGVATKLVVSMTFLYTLIGWKSLLAGLLTFALSVPVNIFVSKRYNKAQGDVMKLRDQKMAVVTEALQGIRQIKFSALERQWQAKIGVKRNQELEVLWKIWIYETGLISLWIFGPVMLSAASLTVYTLLHEQLSPSIAFTTIAIFAQIEGTLASLPELTTDALDAWVSINRIEKYLDAPEKVNCTVPSDAVSFENASIAWPSDSQEEDVDRFILRDINLRFPNKELSVICGKTGSGKSLLLAAILGEVDKISGTIKVPKGPSLQDRFDYKATKGNWIIDSAIAFVAQIPWIENASIKDNILFGLPFDAGRYKTVLSVCALEKDLEMLPDGEMTDIGANGINLSGGQRWRVSFARALYSRAGILVLDDIFSALDAHVGRHLFEEALTGELGVGRTRILVTHHVGLCLPKTKYTVSLGGGTVEHIGLVDDLKQTGSLEQILKKEESEVNNETNDLLNVDGANGDILAKVMSRHSEQSVMIDDGGTGGRGKLQPKKFVEDEKRETGSIKLDNYKEYITTSGGLKLWGPLLFLFVGYMSLILGRSWWVSIWTRSYRTESFFVQHHLYQQLNPTNFESNTTDNEDIWYYLTIYVGLSLIVWLIGTSRYFVAYTASIRASKVMFEKLSYTVLRAPLRWLDTVPVGRVLNRFTADFNTLDSRIASDLGFFFYQTLELIGIMIAGFIVSPFMILFVIPLMILAAFIAIRYLTGAREVKRLESNAKSPIFEQFGSSLAGIGTIRAFDKAEEYIERMYSKIDNHSRAFWHMWLFNRWMGFRLSIVGATFAVSVAGVVVFAKTIDASLAGFALAFALQYTGAVIWTLRSYANLEMDMNSTERIIEYSRLATEDQSGADAPAAWPTQGRLEVHGLVAGYAPDLPPVLKGLSFTAEKEQRVGVVGRTGAGKSSLTLALFRFLEAREGSIFIDGIDVSKIKLHDLRSRLAIIPQDPVLFSGTVRSNLDAFDEHTDAELRDALERVHLIKATGLASRDEAPEASASGSATPTVVASDTNTNIFTSLSSRISEGGLNLSQGQRQLLCLARAIVSRPKIMVLDEATSAVDMATDVLIQHSIREEFGDSTLLVIAHRLSTIADFDRILVMAEGRAVEFGSPRELWEEKGVFWEMVGSSGEKERLEEIILGVGEGGSGAATAETSGSGSGTRLGSEDGAENS